MNTAHIQCYSCEVSCNHCGLAPTLDAMSAVALVDVVRGFLLMHRHCEKRAEPSKQVELFDALAKKESGREIPIICVVCNGPLKDGEDPLTHLDQCRRKARSAADMETEDECSARTVREEMGIDGSSDEPDPETDPPERDADGAPLPPPACPQFAIDQQLEESFRRLRPVATDAVRLHSDLAIALQRHEGATLPSFATLDGMHPSTVRFQEIASWVCFELADMNRKEHPEFDCFLPVERQPMPARLAALLMPPAKKKRGARPLSSAPKKRRSGSTANSP